MNDCIWVSLGFDCRWTNQVPLKRTGPEKSWSISPTTWGEMNTTLWIGATQVLPNFSWSPLCVSWAEPISILWFGFSSEWIPSLWGGRTVSINYSRKRGPHPLILIASMHMSHLFLNPVLCSFYSIYSAMYWMFVSLPNSYVEILPPNVITLGGEPLGGDYVIRPSPHGWD